MDTIDLVHVGTVIYNGIELELYGQSPYDLLTFGDIQFRFAKPKEEGLDGYWVTVDGWHQDRPGHTLYVMPSDRPSADPRFTVDKRSARIFKDKQAAERHVKDCYGHLGGLGLYHPVAIT